MRKIVMIALPVTIFLAGLLVATFALVDLKPAEASVPAQDVVRGEGWDVVSFRAISFEAGQWDQLGQTGSCVIFRSKASLEGTTLNPATLTVVTSTTDFTLEYPKIGARVIVCAGFTAFIPPLSSGIAPKEEDS